MQSNHYKAIVIGATGAVGHSVVHALLASPRCQVVTTIARRNLEIEHDKLTQHILEFKNLREASKNILVEHQVMMVCTQTMYRTCLQCTPITVTDNIKSILICFFS